LRRLHHGSQQSLTATTGAADRAPNGVDELFIRPRRRHPRLRALVSDRTVWLLGAVALAALLPCVVYAQLLDPNRAPADFDSVAYLYPYRHYLAQAWASGRWAPLWNPSIYLGSPFLANIQAAALYPLNLLFLIVGGPSAMGWTMVLHLAIGGIGMLLFAFRAARLRLAGSLVAAFAYVLSSHLTVHLAQVNQSNTLAWTPWLMLVVHQTAVRPRARAIAGIAVITALMVLAGHTQQAYLTFVCAGLAGLLALRGDLARRRWRAVAVATASCVSGIALGAVLDAAQLLPTAELAALSYRQGGLDLAAADVQPLPIKGIMASLLPHYAGPLPPEYAGVSTSAVVLVLAAFALMVRWRQAPVAFWAVVSLVAIWAATGSAGHLFSILFRIIPGLDLFRAPGRLLLLSTLGIALLAGYGVKTVQQFATISHRRPWRDRGLAVAAIAALGWAVLLTAAVAGRVPAVAAHHRLVWVLPLGVGDHDLLLMAAFGVATVLVAAIAIRLGGRMATALVGVGLAALALADTWLATESYHTRHSVAASLYGAPGPVTELVSPNRDQRYLSLAMVTDLGDYHRLDVARRPNIGMGDGRLTPDGYDGGLLPTASYVQFRGPLLGLATSNAPDLTILGQTDRVWDASWLERAGVAAVLTDRGTDPNPPSCQCLQLVADRDGIDLWQPVGFSPSRAWLEGAAGTQPARIIDDTGEHVVVALPGGVGGRLVLADTYYPGWSASVDGHQLAIAPYYGVLRSVDVPAGAKQVVFDYQPASFRVGLVASGIGLLCIALLALWPGRRRWKFK
jgi:hypothetical protein